MKKISLWLDQTNLKVTRFNFNKGVLYNALEKGHIVIYDNIEQTKPEVIEKCNSVG